MKTRASLVIPFLKVTLIVTSLADSARLKRPVWAREILFFAALPFPKAGLGSGAVVSLLHGLEMDCLQTC